jgi:hypothetical protein
VTNPAEAMVDGVLFPSAVSAQVHTTAERLIDEHVLDLLVRDLRVCGVVGEDRNAKVIFLALCSRLLDEPVSVGVKGVSGSGKSFTTEAVLKFFPPSAYCAMTAMSERALIYSKDEFKHRTIVLYEATALREQREKVESNLTAYIVRSLLSEGRIDYSVTVKDKAGNFTSKTITKEGPTNLIVTTTATSLHNENETRMLSLPTNDTPAQTRAILRSLASGPRRKPDVGRWWALQDELEKAARSGVVVPFAPYLAEKVDPVAVRLRRDFRSLLRLIETHALLHDTFRDHDPDGRTIAREEDYVIVRDLVGGLIADGVGATVSKITRETVEAVVTNAGDEGVTVRNVADILKVDRSAAHRRLVAAHEKGFVYNIEDRRGRPARYVVGEPLPEERAILPERAHRTGATCETAGEPGVCTCAGTTEGMDDAPNVVIDQEALDNVYAAFGDLIETQEADK